MPKNKLWLRLTGPVLVTFILAFPIMGILATSDYGSSSNRAPSTLVPPPEVVIGTPSEVAVAHLLKVFKYWTHIPGACRGDGAVNTFQKSQCDVLWESIWQATMIAAVPFLPVILVGLLFYDHLVGFYRRTRKKLTQPPVAKGRVTQPALASSDFFSIYFCLRPISVQVADKQQLRVYLPLDVPIPLPGQHLALYDAGKFLGKKRFVGILHAPHLAVRSAN